MIPVSKTDQRFVRLGPLVVDLSSGEVWQESQRLRIPEQPTRLLLALLERPGEILSREDLRAKLWPSDTNVEFNHSINAAVNKLRQALKDSPESPQFIETVPRRGYRIVARVSPADPLPSSGEIGTGETFESGLATHDGQGRLVSRPQRVA